jgi:sulfoquinovosidase
LLVAPVVEEGVEAREVYLPAGETWVHLWSGAVEEGGQRVSVPAPFGEPPVFYRADSSWEALFAGLPRRA